MTEALSTAFFFTLHVGLESDDPGFSVTGNRERLFAILDDRHNHGYTAIEGIGSFAGRREPCISISVIYVGDGIGHEGAFSYIQETAREIKRALGQQEVWITRRTEGLRVV
jgi:hypothetical protein